MNAVETVSHGIEPVQLVRHESAKDLIRQFFSFTGEDVFEEPDLPTIGDGDGEMMTPNEYAAMVECFGFWAFADTTKRTVHVWHGPEFSRLNALALLGHEIGHCVGTPFKDEEAEESRAHTYGFAAMLAAQWIDPVAEASR